MEFNEGEVAPTARAWFDKDETSPLYSDAEGLLYFLDKYTTIMVGSAKEMSRFYKNNKGKTLLDKVSVSDIAYSVLIYESSYDVWMEDIKSQRCVPPRKRRRHSNTWPKTSTMCNEEPACPCIAMVGQVKVAHTLIPFAVRLRI